MKKVFVTGGTGFIGQHLVSALTKKGYQVRVVARDPQKAKLVEVKGSQVVFGDLEDEDFLKKALGGIDVVYHLAAIPGQIWGIPWEEYKRVNVDYTENILKASLANKVKRFIFCSSIQAVDPSTFYGESKCKAEKAVLRSGLEYVTVRPGIVYGPGDKKAILQICRLVKKGFFPLIDGGKAKPAVIFIDDLINLFLKSLSSEARNKMFWGIGEEITFKDLVGITTKELGKPCWKISLPAGLVKIIAIPFEVISWMTGTEPQISRQQVDFVTFDWHFDITEKEREFWQPKVKFREGIKKTINWYLENNFL